MDKMELKEFEKRSKALKKELKKFNSYLIQIEQSSNINIDIEQRYYISGLIRELIEGIN